MFVSRDYWRLLDGRTSNQYLPTPITLSDCLANAASALIAMITYTPTPTPLARHLEYASCSGPQTGISLGVAGSHICATTIKQINLLYSPPGIEYRDVMFSVPLVPYTPRPMMRYFQPSAHPPLPLLRQIIQEEVYQHSIHHALGFRMLAYYLPPDQLDGPDTAAPELDFPAVARGDLLLVAETVEQGRAVG